LANSQQAVHITAYHIAMEEASGVDQFQIALEQAWASSWPVLELTHEQMQSRQLTVHAR
jgi:hypothetical protein